MGPDPSKMICDLKSAGSSKRDENSLYVLTQKFIKLIRKCPDFHINITQAAEALGVGKRRIYDITNVLEGLGFLTKWSVNSVKWIGNSFEAVDIDDSSPEEPLSVNHERSEEIVQLKAEITQLKEEINNLSMIPYNLENAYVTYDDLQKLNIFKSKLVFALKAPSDSMIEYPHYEKGAHRLKIIAESGQISVYYVNPEK